MVSGKHLSPREADWMREHHTEFLNGTMASKLAESFADDNGGSRHVATVRRFLRREYPDEY